MNGRSLRDLKKICRNIRINIIRMTGRAGSGHPGGSLSGVEILVALYFKIMDHERGDKFILSKGHASALLYAALHERGILTEENLKTFRQFGSPLQGHPSSIWLPVVEFSSGMLGQGLSFANGLAKRAKLEGNPRLHFVLLGEGDLQYGQTWQAFQTAVQHRLDNVIAIADCNEFQIGGRVVEIKNLEPLETKLRAMGWLAYTVDGHDIRDLIHISNFAIRESAHWNLPSMIVAKTVKGKGIPGMEGRNEYHGTAPTEQQALDILKKIGGKPWPK